MGGTWCGVDCERECVFLFACVYSVCERERHWVRERVRVRERERERERIESWLHIHE